MSRTSFLSIFVAFALPRHEKPALLVFEDCDARLEIGHACTSVTRNCADLRALSRVHVAPALTPPKNGKSPNHPTVEPHNWGLRVRLRYIKDGYFVGICYRK